MTELIRARVRRGRWALAGAAVAAVLAFAGCGGEPDPVVTPTEATTSAPTETPSATQTPEPSETSALPPLPEEATQNTPEGAEAFIRYYFDVANLAHTKPQPGLILPLADPECVSCAAMNDQIDGLIAAGQKAKRGPYQIDSMTRLGGGGEGITRFHVEMTQPYNELLTIEGEHVQDAPGRSLSGEMGAIWTGDQWRFFDSGLE